MRHDVAFVIVVSALATVIVTGIALFIGLWLRRKLFAVVQARSSRASVMASDQVGNART